MKNFESKKNGATKVFLFVSAILSGSVFTAGAASVIDIKSPTAGVSHNIYPEFNVGHDGVIFNNSKNASDTQLAGKIAGNSNFSNESARVILAEVRSQSGKASQLNGMMEVAGNRAELIIANPAGIDCNGCGSINTSRLTLAAGSTLVDNLSSTSSGSIFFTIGKGQVTIGNDGMKSGQTDFTDIIASAIKVNGELQAKDLDLHTGEITVARAPGRADFFFDNGSVSSGDRPELALDVSSLGSMYADRITLVGTDKGVGVRNAGTIVSKGDLLLTAKGNFVNEKSAGITGDFVSIGMKDDHIINHGKISGDSFVTLTGKRVINGESGNISSENHIFVTADEFQNNGKVAANGFAAHFSPDGTKFIN